MQVLTETPGAVCFDDCEFGFSCRRWGQLTILPMLADSQMDDFAPGDLHQWAPNGGFWC